MKYICSLLTVNDIELSRDFYENLLNLKVIADFGENITFEGDFAIHLRSHFQSLIENKSIRKGQNDVELYFEDDEVESIAATLIERGTEFVHELREQPWRQLVVRFYDPDGYIIELGETMEHLAFRLSEEGISPEEIAKITYMPKESVLLSIDKYSKK